MAENRRFLPLQRIGYGLGKIGYIFTLLKRTTDPNKPNAKRQSPNAKCVTPEAESMKNQESTRKTIRILLRNLKFDVHQSIIGRLPKGGCSFFMQNLPLWQSVSSESSPGYSDRLIP